MSTVSIEYRIAKAKAQEGILRQVPDRDASHITDLMIEVMDVISEIHCAARLCPSPTIRAQAADWLKALLGPTVEP